MARYYPESICSACRPLKITVQRLGRYFWLSFVKDKMQ